MIYVSYVVFRSRACEGDLQGTAGPFIQASSLPPASHLHVTSPLPTTSYDRVAYPSYTHQQTHPDRLAVIGRLFGLHPAPVTACRVLELGCGDASNLAPMAWGLPQSEFVGIDLAHEPIDRGRRMIRELGMANIRLVQGSVTAIDGTWGKFDYIIAHGLYSWVPGEVREHILRVCRECLAPQGIAFVSYNALPGCHLRSMIREMMLFHVRGIASPDEQVTQSKALLRFLATAEGVASDEYHLWMKAELARVIEHDEGHLYHDELAEINEPFYFTQFMASAASHGLHYLGEADFPDMSDRIFAPPVRETLDRLSSQRLLREQYLDFLKCRRFRQTLLCHQETSLLAHPSWEAVTGFFVSSGAERQPAATGEALPPKTVFLSLRGTRFETDFAPGTAALTWLHASWPAPAAFDDILRVVAPDETGAPRNPGEAAREALAKFFLQLHAAGIVEFRTTPSAAVTSISERPVASELVRWQAHQGAIVSSLFHIAVRVDDEIGRNLLGWLDGSNNRIQLLDHLWAFLKSKNALAGDQGEAALREKLKLELEQNLLKLARFGLLVA